VVSERERVEAVRELLGAWLRAEVYVISETSSDITGSWRKLIEEAERRAEAVGIPWDDTLVPDYVRASIEAEEGDEQ
jgi:hypothetical protein